MKQQIVEIEVMQHLFHYLSNCKTKEFTQNDRTLLDRLVKAYNEVIDEIAKKKNSFLIIDKGWEYKKVRPEIETAWKNVLSYALKKIGRERILVGEIFSKKGHDFF